MNHLNNVFSVCLIFLISCLLISCGQNSSEPTQQTTENKHAFKKEGTLTFISQPETDSSKAKDIEIEIADTEPQRQKGLMYRTSMKENRGMLFIFEKNEPRSFWMKNTAIALDMAFINSDLQIVALQKYVPIFNEKSRDSKGLPAQYVLEVNAGFMDKFGFKEGDKVRFERTRE